MGRDGWWGRRGGPSSCHAAEDGLECGWRSPLGHPTSLLGNDPVHVELQSQSLGESDGRTARTVWSPPSGALWEAPPWPVTKPLPCRAGAPFEELWTWSHIGGAGWTARVVNAGAHCWRTGWFPVSGGLGSVWELLGETLCWRHLARGQTRASHWPTAPALPPRLITQKMFVYAEV